MDSKSATPSRSSTLREAYDHSSELVESEAEPFEVAEEVERLRLVWRPSKVRIVVLAESHIWTSLDELKNCVRAPEGNESKFIPSKFVRFVYCLGYGERSLLAQRIAPSASTRQYWTLLHDTLREPTTICWPHNPQERIAKKLCLLCELKDAGVWLVDASVTALYKPRDGRLVKSKSKYKELLRACWESHVCDIIAGCSASAVLIVGKGVYEAIGDLVRPAVPQAEVEVVKQPNARMKREERNDERRKVFNFCRRHRAGG
jgi:hypothetical protein